MTYTLSWSLSLSWYLPRPRPLSLPCWISMRQKSMTYVHARNSSAIFAGACLRPRPFLFRVEWWPSVRFDSMAYMYCAFWSQGSINHINLTILIKKFVPRDLEWQRNMEPQMAAAGTSNDSAVGSLACDEKEAKIMEWPWPYNTLQSAIVHSLWGNGTASLLEDLTKSTNTSYVIKVLVRWR